MPRPDLVLFAAPIGLLAVLALLPGMLAPSLDAAVFSVVGERVAAGDLPYVDVFDHKPPGLYLLIAMGQLIPGSLGAWTTSWVLSVGAVVLTGIVVADTLRRLGWGRIAWFVAALCVAELASFPLARGGGAGETIGVLPAVAALRVVAIGPASARRQFTGGVLAGLAAAVTLQAAAVLLALLVAAVVRQDRTTDSRSTGRLLAAVWIVVGAASVTAWLVALLGTAGATGAAVQAVVNYNRAFASLGAFDDSMAAEALHALLVLSPLLIPALLGLPRTLRDPSLRPIALGSLTWLAGVCAAILVQGRLEVHYVTMLVPPLALLAAGGLSFAPHVIPRQVRATVDAGLMVAALLVFGILSVTETAMALESRAAKAAHSRAIASWIGANSQPGDSIFVWGNAPEVYLDANRPPASPYVYLLPLTTPGYVSEPIVEGVLADWTAAPPAVIIDAGSPSPGAAGAPPLLIQRPVSAGDGRTVDLLGPLRAFVQERYQLAATIEGWPIYLRADLRQLQRR
jgi:hypothetical protein